MKKYMTIFEVSGRMSFPLDMLRYDSCHPHRSEDASTIANSFTPSNIETVTVQLVKYHDVKVPQITTGRWNSFLWGVGRVLETRKL